MLLVSLLGIGLKLASAQESPQMDWQRFAGSVFPVGVRVGAKIHDPVVYETDSQSDFIPASVTKIATLAAVLGKLGPDHRFETTLTWSQSGDEAKSVRLVGDGDPSLKAEIFKTFAEQLKNAGVGVIRGPIIVEASDPRLDDEVIPPGNRDDNLVWCFGAQPASFNIDHNCGLVAVTSLTAGSWYDPGIGHPIRVELEAGKTNDFEIVRDGDGYSITGTGNLNTFPVYLDLRVLRPIDRARALFQNALSSVGIGFTIEPGETREVQGLSYTHYSEPLKDLVKPIIKSSLNPPLESLQRALGKKFGGSGALVEEGAKVIAEYLGSEISSTARSPVFVDGSGLSRSNFITASWIYDFLVQMKSKTYFDHFLKALSVGGVDGTLKRRWVGTIAEGKVFGKTGTLTGHSNVVGYLTDSLVPFVLLNDYDGDKIPVWKVRNAQNKMVLKWFEQLNPQTVTASSLSHNGFVHKRSYLIGLD